MISCEKNCRGFVYKWTNKINGHWYIGSHKGYEDDGYVGSGVSFKNAITKHGIENFEREILYIGFDFREAEERILIELDAASDVCSYNHKNKAFGCVLSGENNGMFGKQLTDEQRYRCGKAFRGKKRPEHSKKMSGKNNPMFGKSEHSHGMIAYAKSMSGKTLEEIHGKQKASQIKEKLSKSHIGIKKNFLTVICPHCKTQGSGPNMTKYHFDKCDLERIKQLKLINSQRINRKQNRIDRKLMIKLLYEKNISITEIANKLKISHQMIHRDLRSFGIKYKVRK